MRDRRRIVSPASTDQGEAMAGMANRLQVPIAKESERPDGQLKTVVAYYAPRTRVAFDVSALESVTPDWEEFIVDLSSAYGIEIIGASAVIRQRLVSLGVRPLVWS